MVFALKKCFSPTVNQNDNLYFLQIFKPVYALLSIFGLFPQAIEFPGDEQKTKSVTTKTSVMNWICTFLTIAVVSIFYVFHVILQLSEGGYKESSLTRSTMTNWNLVFILSAQLLFCTITYFHVIRDRNLYITILNEMSACWAMLANGLKMEILRKMRVQVNCVALGSLLTSVLTTITFFVGFYHYTTWKLILCALTRLLPELIEITLTEFYLVMILMIVALLKNIEEEIKTTFSVKRVQNNSDEWNVEVDLAQLRDVYIRTLEIKRQVNAAFQAPILVLMAVSFWDLVSLPHMVYHALRYQPDFPMRVVIAVSYWCLNQLLKMYTLGHSGAMLTTQVNQIGRTIHSIPLSEHQYKRVQHFLSLMTYQDITTTIYGWFPLDSALLFNVLASAAMYVVILVQFDKPD